MDKQFIARMGLKMAFLAMAGSLAFASQAEAKKVKVELTAIETEHRW